MLPHLIYISKPNISKTIELLEFILMQKDKKTLCLHKTYLFLRFCGIVG